ncbi:hypothetical protein [Streptomyces sp. YPW6]|uniref:hypothetical protein n=1 Tax=Streptomyces sp. YPW6 TaxID=2840373 RepID=UPI003D73D656
MVEPVFLYLCTETCTALLGGLMPEHRRRKSGRTGTVAGAATMAAAMSWMAVVGIRGPQHDHVQAPSVRAEDDESPAELRRDVDVSDGYAQRAPATDKPDTRRTAEQPAQPPTLRPLVAQDVMSATEIPVPAEQPSQAAAEAVSPVSGASAAPTTETRKAPTEKTPRAAKRASPETPGTSPAPKTFIVQNAEGFEVSAPKDEPDAWDAWGDFWGTFNPFMTSLSALPPRLQEWKEDVIEQYVDSTPPEREGIVEQLEEVLPLLTDSIGDTPQPDRHEQLKPTVLPPISTSLTEESPSIPV